MTHRMTCDARVMRSGLACALVLAAATTVQAASGTWNATTDGSWSDTSKWLGGTLADIADGATYTATFEANITANRTVTLDGARTIGHLSFNDTSGGNQFMVAGNNTLTIDPTGAGGGTSNWDVASGTTAILGSSGTSTLLAGSSVTINKTGAGVLLLSNNNSTNTLTGSLNITSGGFTLGSSATGLTSLKGVSLRLGGGSDNVAFNVGTGNGADGTTYLIGGTSVLAGSGTVTMNYSGGIRTVVGGGLSLGKSVTINSTTGPLQLGSVSGAGGIVKTGVGSLDLTSSNSFGGGVTLSQGALRMYGSGAGSFSGGITVGDANTGANSLTVNIGNNTMNAPINFTANGTGAATLASLNGQNAGTQAGTVTLNRNIILTTGGGANLTVSGPITGGGALRTAPGSNVIILSGNSNFSGGTTIGGGITRTGNANALGTGAVSVLPGSTARLDLNSTSLGIASLSSAALSGSIAVASQGTGYTSATVNISAPDVAGGTPATATATVSGGKVTAITITNFGSGYAQAPTIAISGDGSGAAATVPVYVASSVTLGSGTLTLKGTNPTPAVYSGVISGAGQLIKEGSGTQILTGANLYTGNTTVSGGLLRVDGSVTSNVTVNNTGVIGGSGTINGALAINSGAKLSPGASPGTLTVNNNTVTWAGGGAYEWQLLDTTAAAGTGWDLTNVTGTGTLAVTATTGNPFILSLETLEGVSPDDPGAALGFTPNVEQQWLIASAAGGITGWDVGDGVASELFDIDSSGFVGAVGDFAVVKNGNQVYLNYVVPEPSSVALLAMGLIGLGSRRRAR